MNSLALKTHLSLLIMSFLTWSFFVVVGLPDYYQSWSYEAKIILLIGLTILYIPLAKFMIKKMFPDKEYFKNSIWLAFYLTVPLFLFDTVFIGIIGGEGLKFIPKYWILTFFYFSFWVQFPLIGLVMEKNLEEKK